MKKTLAFIIIALICTATMATMPSQEPMLPMIKIGFNTMLQKWLMNLGWILIASMGFGVGTGIAIKIFDFISVGIDEWEEVRKGNMGVVAILVSIIVMVGIIVVVSIA